MSTQVAALPARAAGRQLWLSQALTVAAIETRRSFFGLRALGMVFLCGFPVLIEVVAAWLQLAGILGKPGELPSVGQYSQAYSVFYNTVILRLVVFFVCALVFTRLFRAELQQRSLHYYFLAPLRREVLAAGKFFSGLVVTGLVVALTVALTHLIHFLPLTKAAGSGGYGAFYAGGGGTWQLLGYVAVAVLGVVGYGAAFFAAGLFVRNPIVPVVALYGWEWLNFLLPPLLKKFSVIHYLQGLLPVPPPQGSIALLAEPPSPWVAIPGLLLVASALLWFSAKKVRAMEIHYGEE